MKENGNYVKGVGYALAKLGAVPNVYNYVDAGHHGWLGWDTNFAPAVQMMMTAATASGATPANVHGFITNTANTSALQEPYITVDSTTRPSTWIDWNQYNDELTFAQAFRNQAVSAGLPVEHRHADRHLAQRLGRRGAADGSVDARGSQRAHRRLAHRPPHPHGQLVQPDRRRPRRAPAGGTRPRASTPTSGSSRRASPTARAPTSRTTRARASTGCATRPTAATRATATT